MWSSVAQANGHVQVSAQSGGPRYLGLRYAFLQTSQTPMAAAARSVTGVRRGVSARRNPHRHHAAEARPLRTRRRCSWAWHAAVNPQTYVVMAFEIPLCAARAPLPWWHAAMRRRHTTRCRSRPEFLSKDFCARWQVAARAVERDARQVPSHAQHLRSSLGCTQVLGHRKVSVVVRGLALG